MHIEKRTITATTAADGTATAYSSPINGKIVKWQYVPDGTAPFASTTDVILFSETAGYIVNKTNLSAAFTELVTNVVYFADERIKIALGQGGDTKTGIFHFWIE